MAGSRTAYRYPRPLLAGRLIRRYKRFLADVELDSGEVITAHTPNTGAMMGCSEPGARVYLSESDNPTRRLRYTWEITDVGSTLVGVNTLVPNRLIYQAICDGQIPELSGYDTVKREQRISTSSRIDLYLEDSRRGRCFVEIKNVTLGLKGAGRFPDAVTDRGKKHLLELRRVVRRGHRGVILFVVQRMDCHKLQPADDIDPDYGKTLRRVVAGGVEALAYRARVSPKAVRLDRRIPVEL